MSNYKRAYASIDLTALKHNLAVISARLPKGVKVAAAVKADGYGHGAVPIANAMKDRVSFFCVATAEEGVNLDRHGVGLPILILGPVPGDDYREVVAHDLRACIFCMEQAKHLSDEAKAAGRTAKIHIAVDTGMNRIGVKPNYESLLLVRDISRLKGIEIEGIFTHLFSADEGDKSAAKEQIRRFREFCERLEEMGICPKLRHVANSAGIIGSLGHDFNMVRAGILMYGLLPSAEATKLDVKPVMGLHSTITYIKTIRAGESVSYGATFIAKKSTRVATVPIGYGDGYPRSLSNKGFVLICGKPAAILGRVCMDQMMVDVSDIEDAKIGSHVTLVGKDGDREIGVMDLCALCDRFHYEFVCDISKRVPRIYFENGEMTGIKDYLDDDYTALP